MPFIQKRINGWGYHSVVREQMLRYKNQRSPKSWMDLHSRLATYYDKLCDNLELDEEEKDKNQIWQEYASEALYHRICQAPQKVFDEGF